MQLSKELAGPLKEAQNMPRLVELLDFGQKTAFPFSLSGHLKTYLWRNVK